MSRSPEPYHAKPGTHAGRLAVVTGANTGIGRVTARELARAGAEVILACRSEEKAGPVVDAIRRETGNGDVWFHELDLSDLNATRASAEALLALGKPIDILVNNAGIAGKRGLTEDGFELMFGVNHLGPFLFTLTLMPRLLEAGSRGDARVVNVASRAHTRALRIPWDRLREPARGPTGLAAYQVSKLCNVLFSAELARRLKGRGVASYAVHPGVVATDLWRELPGPLEALVKRFMIDTEQGAATQLWCALSDEARDRSGCYVSERTVMAPSRLGRDPVLAVELWERSLVFTGAPNLS